MGTKKRKKWGPEGPTETKPNLIFMQALGSEGLEGKSREESPIFFYQCNGQI